ncbi:MAG: hypothetical protein A2X86_08835 [Bdellovibrionales bacterium GWA2_49_15]|nr:MAG: hypothetical protein A2X86_08835 [Bdellovibrionales bacterium GWA2_49_15]
MNKSSPHVRSIAGDLIFTVLTFGLFNIYVQYVQIQALNDMLKQPKYSFLKWAFFSIITFGLYHIYHEYRIGRDLAILLGHPESFSPYLQVLLTCFALHIIADAIQQSEINQYFGVNSL